ncbi:hypothetical protein [Haploplasma axanthum]|uniref:Uncharacterized protein n=1 Tax=Haploplasma axanthum TaxID=29552 RepID=A0A449BDA2_HAPAX|nr:hypothetical protein [Haploplasma axanthum]VEU80397.1 Uncharacterised protein [Haploplasma axanthum]
MKKKCFILFFVLMNIVFISSNVKAAGLSDINPTTSEFNNAQTVKLNERKAAAGSSYGYNVSHFQAPIAGAYNFIFESRNSGTVAKIYEEENALFFYKRVLRKEGTAAYRKYTYPGQEIIIYDDLRIEMDLDKDEDYYIAHSAIRGTFMYEYKIEVNQDYLKYDKFSIWTQDIEYRMKNQGSRSISYIGKETMPLYYAVISKAMDAYIDDYLRDFEYEEAVRILTENVIGLLELYLTTAIPGLDIFLFCLKTLNNVKLPNLTKTDFIYASYNRQKTIRKVTGASEEFEGSKYILDFNSGIREDYYILDGIHNSFIVKNDGNNSYGIYANRGTFYSM